MFFNVEVDKDTSLTPVPKRLPEVLKRIYGPKYCSSFGLVIMNGQISGSSINTLILAACK